MTDKQFVEFMALLMCSDPWPVHDGGNNQIVMEDLADDEAKKRGHDGWIEAFHEFKVGTKCT